MTSRSRPTPLAENCDDVRDIVRAAATHATHPNPTIADITTRRAALAVRRRRAMSIGAAAAAVLLVGGVIATIRSDQGVNLEVEDPDRVGVADGSDQGPDASQNDVASPSIAIGPPSDVGSLPARILAIADGTRVVAIDSFRGEEISDELVAPDLDGGTPRSFQSLELGGIPDVAHVVATSGACDFSLVTKFGAADGLDASASAIAIRPGLSVSVTDCGTDLQLRPRPRPGSVEPGSSDPASVDVTGDRPILDLDVSADGRFVAFARARASSESTTGGPSVVVAVIDTANPPATLDQAATLAGFLRAGDGVAVSFLGDRLVNVQPLGSANSDADGGVDVTILESGGLVAEPDHNGRVTLDTYDQAGNESGLSPSPWTLEVVANLNDPSANQILARHRETGETFVAAIGPYTEAVWTGSPPVP